MTTSTTTTAASPERRMFAPELKDRAAQRTPAGKPTAAASRAVAELAYRANRKGATPAPITAAAPAVDPAIAEAAAKAARKVASANRTKLVEHLARAESKLTGRGFVPCKITSHYQVKAAFADGRLTDAKVAGILARSVLPEYAAPAAVAA